MLKKARSEQKFDVSKVREEFPVSENWIYFQSYQRGPLPKSTSNVLAAYFNDQLMNAGAKYAYWSDVAEQARSRLAEYLGARPEMLAFTKNASDALGILLENYNWKRGFEIVTSQEEYPAYLRYLRRLQSKGIKCRVLDDRTKIISEVNQNTQMVLVSHVSYKQGTRVELADIINACHKCATEVVVDAVQSLGVFRIDVDALKIDFLLGNSRKWMLGVEGLGFLYINPLKLSYIDRLCDRQSISEVENTEAIDGPHSFGADAKKLEPGGRNKIAMIALGASLSVLQNVGWSIIEERVLSLYIFAANKAKDLLLNVISPIGEPSKSSGILAIRLDSSQKLQALLSYLLRNQVLVTGYGATMVIGIHFFNTEQEIEVTLDLISNFLANYE